LVPCEKFCGVDVGPELFVFAKRHLYMSVLVFPDLKDIKFLHADSQDPHDDLVSQT
jgi:hypothetical protein